MQATQQFGDRVRISNDVNFNGKYEQVQNCNLFSMAFDATKTKKFNLCQRYVVGEKVLSLTQTCWLLHVTIVRLKRVAIKVQLSGWKNSEYLDCNKSATAESTLC